MSRFDSHLEVREERIRAAVERYFGTHSREELDAILAELEPLVVPGGEWLFREGEAGAELLIIARGRLQVWSEPVGAPPRLLGELGPGETVGEVGLLAGGTRTASVRAIRDSALLRMDREAFERLAATHPSLVLELAAQVAARLRDRTSGVPRQARGPENLAIVPLGDEGTARRFAEQLAVALEVHGSAHRVRAAAVPGGDVAQAGEWLDALEAQYDYLLLECEPRLSPWSELCLRHADVVLLVADSDHPPSPGEFGRIARVGGTAARRVLVLVHDGDRVEHGARWRRAIEPDVHHHVRTGRSERDVARLARIVAGRSIGLVLGGGAARGFAHVGVYRALCEAGIPVDWVGGTSIGSVFAASIALDWSPDQLEALARHAFVDENPLGDYTLPLVALLRGRRVQRLVEQHFAHDIEDLPIPYFCVSSHLDRGEIDVHESGDLRRAIRASVAIPGVLPPAVVDGHLAIDGGVLNNLPVDVMRARVSRVIAVDVSVREHDVVQYDEVPSPFQLLRARLLPFGRAPRAPSILNLMVKASFVASAAHTQAMQRAADLLLQPPVAEFGLLDVRPFDELVAVGYEHARSRLAEWKPLVSS